MYSEFIVEPIEEVEVSSKPSSNTYFTSSAGNKFGDNAKFFVGLPDIYEKLSSEFEAESISMLERYEETHEHAVAQLSNQDTQKCFTAITFLIASLYQLNEHSDYTNAKLDKDQISNMINSLSPKQIINIYDNHNSYGIHWTNSLSKQLNVNQKVESPEPLLYNQGNKRSEYISRLASKPMIPN